MAIITDNSSHPEQRDATRALRDELAKLSLRGVADSMRASRYAVSSVDAANVPTLVGAQIGGNTGTQGGTGPTRIVGRDSVQVSQIANLATVQLLDDAPSPAYGTAYGVDSTGARGFYALASLLAAGSNVTLATAPDGVTTISSSGGGVSSIPLVTGGLVSGQPQFVDFADGTLATVRYA